MSIKINELEIENTKRVKAVKLEPSKNGLTVIGGKNEQGKTSVIDSIAWALGGNKYAPSDAQRKGSTIPPRLKVVLSDGTIVERAGKNSSLKVIDPSGRKSGQKLLDTLIENLALDLPKFLESSNKEKANILLQIIGVGEELMQLEKQEQDIYNERYQVGRIADQKEKYAKEQPYYLDAPKELISPKDLIDKQQEILARNGENVRKRDNLDIIKLREKQLSDEIEYIVKQLNAKKLEHEKIKSDLYIAETDVIDLQDQSTEELEASINNIDEINVKVRANLDKEKAEEDAKDYKDQYNVLTAKIETVRKQKMDLLSKADLPLPELSVSDGELIYKEQKWDNMSASQQLKVSTAIIRKLKPECGFVLMDKLEQMDIETMNDFGAWAEQEGLQIIATRVSTGGECSIIIEDGYVKEDYTSTLHDLTPQTPKWKAGEF